MIKAELARYSYLALVAVDAHSLLVLLALSFPADWHCCSHFGGDLVDLGARQLQVGVHLRLVHLVRFGQREQRYPPKDDECDAVEAGAHVREAPQQHAELERVHQVLHQEEPAMCTTN